MIAWCRQGYRIEQTLALPVRYLCSGYRLREHTQQQRHAYRARVGVADGAFAEVTRATATCPQGRRGQGSVHCGAHHRGDIGIAIQRLGGGSERVDHGAIADFRLADALDGGETVLDTDPEGVDIGIRACRPGAE